MRPRPSAVRLAACIGILATVGTDGVDCAAAERPLGMVESVDGQQLVLRFDASAHLLPGSMVAIYGPGSVEKHPLTKEVIIENRKLLAKAQLTGGDDLRPQARILWPAAPEGIVAGLDAVPMSEEAAPNAAPAMAGAAPKTSAATGSTVLVKLPIADPDGDAVSYQWSLSGSDGAAGRLDARTTTAPEILWTAPGTVGSATISAIARDAGGHETTFQAPLESVALEDVRKRDLAWFAHWGEDAERPLARVERDADGTWWGLTESDAKLTRISSGWTAWASFSFAASAEPRGAVAVAAWRKELFILDSKTSSVLVFGADGGQKRAIGRCDKPSDLVIAGDGTLFIADQGAGGVQVYEADGRFRGRIGRAGDGDEDFKELSRIALGPGGELFALDSAKRRIQRFDRFQRRLASWPVTGDPNLQPVDIAVHPRGVLLLLTNGQIQIYDAKGLAREAMNPLTEARLCGDPGKAAALTVDASGEIFVTYPDSGLVARYSAQGAVTGVRGASLREPALWSCDGNGRVYALDADDGSLYVHDAEGWRTARLGGLVKKGGPFANPIALCASPDGQTVAVLDAKKMAVVRLRPGNPKEAPLVFGQPGKNNGQFDDPIALSVDEAGRTYVLDQGLYRVSVFDDKGSFLFAFGTNGKNAADLKEPKLIAASPAGDAVFVYDAYRYEIKKFATDFKLNTATHVTNTGGKGDGAGQIRELVGLGCDRLGLLYLADSSRGDLQSVDFRGNSAVAISAHKFADFGMRKVTGMAVAPDGQPWLIGPSAIAGVRWK